MKWEGLIFIGQNYWTRRTPNWLVPSVKYKFLTCPTEAVIFLHFSPHPFFVIELNMRNYGRWIIWRLARSQSHLYHSLNLLQRDSVLSLTFHYIPFAFLKYQHFEYAFLILCKPAVLASFKKAEAFCATSEWI